MSRTYRLGAIGFAHRHINHLHLEVMAILDAGIRSAASGKLELVNDATWCIG